MRIITRLEIYLKRIETIKYENENGGAYAYLQFMAYSRDLLTLLRPFKKVEKQLESLEGINWLFNECLTARFTHRQKAIFENKLSDARQIFNLIRLSLEELESETHTEVAVQHPQAA